MYSTIGRKGTKFQDYTSGLSKNQNFGGKLVSSNGFYFPKKLIQFDAEGNSLPNLIQSISGMKAYAKFSPIYLRTECVYQSC